MSNAHITSPTAAIKILLGGCNPASFKTKEVLAQLAEQFPHIETHYRFVFGTLKRLAQSYGNQEAENLDELVEKVFEHAKANYDKGWDFYVECWGRKELLECMEEAKLKTYAQVIRFLGIRARTHLEQERAVLAEVF